MYTWFLNVSPPTLFLQEFLPLSPPNKLTHSPYSKLQQFQVIFEVANRFSQCLVHYNHNVTLYNNWWYPTPHILYWNFLILIDINMAYKKHKRRWIFQIHFSLIWQSLIVIYSQVMLYQDSTCKMFYLYLASPGGCTCWALKSRCCWFCKIKLAYYFP